MVTNRKSKKRPPGMNPLMRRIVQAVLYELIAVAAVGPALALLFNEPMTSTMSLAIVMSTIAPMWNYVFNGWFERWEVRQETKGRSFKRRVMHGLGFEGGLAIVTRLAAEGATTNRPASSQSV